LRGIQPGFVAQRTKLAERRIHEIERGEVALPPDGRGRLTARALAQAIGADGDEAVRILVEHATAAASDRKFPWKRLRSLALWSAGLLAAVTTLWMAGSWLLGGGPEDPVRVIRRTDYVQRALDEGR
jgi:hypothetical protein